MPPDLPPASTAEEDTEAERLSDPAGTHRFTSFLSGCLVFVASGIQMYCMHSISDQWAFEVVLSFHYWEQHGTEHPGKCMPIGVGISEAWFLEAELLSQRSQRTWQV